jgi:Lectin C-type domain
MVRHSAAVFYQRCFNLSEYSLCLSTDGSQSKSWGGAQQACAENNWTLLDVLNNETQTALQQFRADSNASLSTTGNWIRVSTNIISASFHWIVGQQNLISGGE